MNRFLLLLLLTEVAMATQSRAQNSLIMEDVFVENGTCLSNATVDSCICSEKQSLQNEAVTCVYNWPNNSTDSTFIAKVKSLECVTYDNSSLTAVSGRCTFTAKTLTVKHLPGNLTMSEVNDKMCGSANRMGTLCGLCKENSTLSFNTYGMNCVKNCRVVSWAVYLLMDFVPIVIFFIIIAVFNIQASAPHMSSFIIYAQIVALSFSMISMERDWMSVLGEDHSSLATVLVRIMETVYGVWNLDISKGIFPEVCVNSEVDMLLAYSLQYISAVFPLLLIVTVYFMIELHERGFRLFILLWKPFSACFSRVRRRLDPKTSIIDTFATFLVLSYTKFTIISFILLAPTTLSNVSGETVKTVWLYDGSVEYFCKEHKPYAILAILMLLVSVIPPPLLLLLYPFGCFQKFLHRCKLQNHLLMSFMDSFQGCYKDGTNSPIDCRFCAGIYFALRILIFGLYAFVPAYSALFLVLHIVSAGTALIIIIIRPYKEDVYNRLNAVVCIYYSFITAMSSYEVHRLSQDQSYLLFQCMYYIVLFLPFIVLVGYTTKKLLRYVCSPFNHRNGWLVESKRSYHSFASSCDFSSPVRDLDREGLFVAD